MSELLYLVLIVGCSWRLQYMLLKGRSQDSCYYRRYAHSLLQSSPDSCEPAERPLSSFSQPRLFFSRLTNHCVSSLFSEFYPVEFVQPFTLGLSHGWRIATFDDHYR